MCVCIIMCFSERKRCFWMLVIPFMGTDWIVMCMKVRSMLEVYTLYECDLPTDHVAFQRCDFASAINSKEKNSRQYWNSSLISIRVWIHAWIIAESSLRRIFLLTFSLSSARCLGGGVVFICVALYFICHIKNEHIRNYWTAHEKCIKSPR